MFEMGLRFKKGKSRCAFFIMLILYTFSVPDKDAET